MMATWKVWFLDLDVNKLPLGAEAGDGSGLLYLRTPHYFSHEEIKLLGGPGCWASMPLPQLESRRTGGSEAGGAGAVPCAATAPTAPELPRPALQEGATPGLLASLEGPQG